MKNLPLYMHTGLCRPRRPRPNRLPPKLFAAALLLLLPTGCKFFELGLYKVFEHGPSVDERIGSFDDFVAAPETTLTDGKFAFLVTSDVHFGNKGKSYARDDEGFYDAVDDLLQNKAVKPSFMVCLGDVIENGDREEEWEDFREWCRTINGKLSPYNKTPEKVYTTTGNHDLYNGGWSYFTEYAKPGTGMFRFAAAGFSFYFLDTGSGSLGKKQYDKFKKAVEADENPKIICTHYPAYGTAQFFQDYYILQNTEETDTLITLCEENDVKLYLSGHMHAQHENDLGSFSELVLPCYAVDHKFALVTVDTATKHVDWDFLPY